MVFEETPQPTSGLWEVDANAPLIVGPRLIGFTDRFEYSFPMTSVHLKVDIQLAVAFIELDVEFYLQPSIGTNDMRSYVFEFPTRHDATVTHCVCQLENKKVFECQIVENTPGADSNYKQREGRGMALAMQYYRERSGRDVGKFDAELFNFPFYDAKLGEKVRLKVSYTQNLEFSNGVFSLRVPLTVQDELFSDTLQKQTTLDARISTGLRENAKFGSTSHASALVEVPVENEDGSSSKSIQLHRNGAAAWVNKDFNLFYMATSENDSLVPRAIFQQAPNPKNDPTLDEGVLSVFLSPPCEQNNVKAVPKDVVFILDRSGSMGFSNVMDAAKEALVTGLQALNPNDRFSICAFDDRQIWFAGALPQPSREEFNRFFERLTRPDGQTSNAKDQVERPSDGRDVSHLIVGNEGNPVGVATNKVYTPENKAPYLKEGVVAGKPNPQEMDRTPNAMLKASPGNVEKAVNWVRQLQAGGLTDILTPMEQATYALHNHKLADEIKMGVNNSSRLSMMFVITDGAVENEREICKYTQAISETTRVFAFGIGHDCNAYFIRKVASLGGGYSDVALMKREVKAQMSRLFTNAKLPVLTDININLGTKDEKLLTDISWCPARFPDLFYNAPVMISMRYKGRLNNNTELSVQGLLSTSQGENRSIFLVTINAEETSHLNLRKVFAQKMVQESVADSWLADLDSDEGKMLKQRAIDLAVAEQITTPFTHKAVVETTQDEYDKRKKEEELQKDDWNRSNSTYKKLADNRGYVIIGGVAAAVAFGSVAATVGTVLGDAGLGMVDPACCDGCDGCCDDCLECCEGCEC